MQQMASSHRVLIPLQQTHQLYIGQTRSMKPSGGWTLPTAFHGSVFPLNKDPAHGPGLDLFICLLGVK